MSKRIEDKDDRTTKGDDHYVSLVQEGDMNAFKVLVEKHQKKMLNIAYRMIGDYEEACEVVQEAFLSAFKAIRTFRGDATFPTWLTAITINHARNRIKQIKSRSRYEGLSIDDPVRTGTDLFVHEASVQDASAEEQLEQKELRHKVQDCVSTLDEEFREVLVLRDMQGFSYEEIGVILRLPDGTVKSRLFRAREAVKNCLKKALGDL